MVRDGLELMYALSIEKSLFKGSVLSSRTYVLFFKKIHLYILKDISF